MKNHEYESAHELRCKYPNNESAKIKQKESKNVASPINLPNSSRQQRM